MLTRYAKPAIWGRLLVALPLILGGSGAIAQGFEPCKLVAGEEYELDIDFTQPPWDGGNRAKTYAPVNSNISVAAGPRLSQDADNGYGAGNNAFIDSSGEDFTVEAAIPTLLSGACISGLDAGDIVKITYEYRNPTDLASSTSRTIEETSTGSGTWFIPFEDLVYPGEGGTFKDAYDGLPITRVLFETGDSKSSFSVLGLRVSEGKPVSAGDTNLFNTGLFQTQVADAEEGYSGEFRIEKFLWFREVRQECNCIPDPASGTTCEEPPPLLVDLDTGETTILDSNEKLAQIAAELLSADGTGMQIPYKIIVPSDLCGKEQSVDGDPVIACVSIDSEIFRSTSEVYEMLFPDETSELGNTQCTVTPSDSLGISAARYNLEPPMTDFDGLQRMAGNPVAIEGIHIEVGCESNPGAFRTRFSNICYNLKDSPHMTSQDYTARVLNLLSKSIELTDVIAQCTQGEGEGFAQSIISSQLTKAWRLVSQGKSSEAVAVLKALEDQLNTDDVETELEQCYWQPADYTGINPILVPLPPPEDPNDVPLGAGTLLKAEVDSIQYQICSRIAERKPDGTWVDPLLDEEVCGPMLGSQ
jgi:hypothetical protein